MPVRRQCFSDTTGQRHIGTHGDLESLHVYLRVSYASQTDFRHG